MNNNKDLKQVFLPNIGGYYYPYEHESKYYLARKLADNNWYIFLLLPKDTFEEVHEEYLDITLRMTKNYIAITGG